MDVLTERQRGALAMMPAVYRWTQGSMPSLERRGLVARTRHRSSGRSWTEWYLTAAGTAAQAQIRLEARTREH
jgi:hypothetical protein